MVGSVAAAPTAHEAQMGKTWTSESQVMRRTGRAKLPHVATFESGRRLARQRSSDLLAICHARESESMRTSRDLFALLSRLSTSTMERMM